MGTVVPAADGTHPIHWDDGPVWHADPEFFSGTLADQRVTWNYGPSWNVVSLLGQRMQTLTALTDYSYSRTQESTLMAETYTAAGLKLTESTGDVGTYDPETGIITWRKPDSLEVPMLPWTKAGVPPQRLGQVFRFTDSPGHNILYLHGNGSMSGLNSRGPGRASTCIAKIPLDPTQPVTHVSIQRPHRWIQQCPGTLSSLSFSLRDALGNIHSLSDYGQSPSFVLTWAMKD